MMERRDASKVGGVVVLVLVIAALGFMVMRPGEAEVRIAGDPAIGATDDGTAVVAGLRRSGGFSLFGLRLVDPTHYVEVRFSTRPGCSEVLDSGEAWPTTHAGCTGPAGIDGSVASLGIDASGRSIVGVEFTVPRDCYEALQPGDPWTALDAVCG